MSEAERLTAFLLALQTSPALRHEFKRDPEAVMRRFNLGLKTKHALHHKHHKTLWGILVSPATREKTHVATTVGVEKGHRRRKRMRN